MEKENVTVQETSEEFYEKEDAMDKSGTQEGVVDLPESHEAEDADDGLGGIVDRIHREKREQEEEDARKNDEKKQSREENAQIKAARIAAKREAERDAKAEADRQIAASGVVNPKTGKPFTSIREFMEYGKDAAAARIKREAERTGRTEAEIEEEERDKAFLRELRAAKDTKKEGTDDFLENDLADFVERYPEFSDAEKLEALEKNKSFRKFAGSRYGKEPLGDLYEDFLSLTTDAAQTAIARQQSKAARSTGGSGQSGVHLSAAQARELEQWNRDNPDMVMTAKEFYGS